MVSLPFRAALQIFKHTSWWKTAHGQPRWYFTREIWSILAFSITSTCNRFSFRLFHVILSKTLQSLESLCFPSNQRHCCHHWLSILLLQQFRRKLWMCKWSCYKPIWATQYENHIMRLSKQSKWYHCINMHQQNAGLNIDDCVLIHLF